MKILDRYILSRFLFNFITSFSILMFIFIFYSIWIFIGELAGKGLDLGVIAKFILYYMPNLIPIILPLTVVLSSIMTFGSFAENYEFAAMKSSGISLKRAMRSVTFFMILLSIGAFFTANNVIPYTETKSFNLRRNIAKVKPAMAIAEGVFNDINNLSIKVAKKYGENDKFLDNVIIHKKSPNQKNNVVIKAKSGEFKNQKNANYIQLILKDGNYYEDITGRTMKTNNKYLHAKSSFKTYTMNIDLAGSNDVDLNKIQHTNTYKMLNVVELNHYIDSLSTNYKKNIAAFGDNIYKRTGITNKLPSIDSTSFDVKKTKQQVLSLFDDSWQKLQIVKIANTTISNVVNTLKSKEKSVFLKKKIINLHVVSLHDKFALALGCLLLFFVAAPLGAIIKKGGMGLPIVIAIFLFLTYHFIGLFSKNFAEDGSIHPVLASWLPTLLILPLAISLTQRASADKAALNTDKITDPIVLFFKKIFSKKKKTSPKKTSKKTKTIAAKYQGFNTKALRILDIYIIVFLLIMASVFTDLSSVLLGVTCIILLLIHAIGFIVFYTKTPLAKNLISTKKRSILFLLGIIFYPILYFYWLKKIQQ